MAELLREKLRSLVLDSKIESPKSEDQSDLLFEVGMFIKAMHKSRNATSPICHFAKMLRKAIKWLRES